MLITYTRQSSTHVVDLATGSINIAGEGLLVMHQGEPLLERKLTHDQRIVAGHLLIAVMTQQRLVAPEGCGDLEAGAVDIIDSSLAHDTLLCGATRDRSGRLSCLDLDLFVERVRGITKTVQKRIEEAARKARIRQIIDEHLLAYEPIALIDPDGYCKADVVFGRILNILEREGAYIGGELEKHASPEARALLTSLLDFARAGEAAQDAAAAFFEAKESGE